MEQVIAVTRTSQWSPIFVVGAPRSGTTLMGKILDRHVNIYTPGETHFFEDVWARRKALGELTTERQLSNAADRVLRCLGRFHQRGQKVVDDVLDKGHLVQRTIELGGGYQSLYMVFMSALAESQGKHLICDDTPRHIFNLHTVFNFYPQAKVIGCIRDPRDFLSSYKGRWRVSEDEKRIKALYHPVITSLLWRSSTNLLIKAMQKYGDERVLAVRYEELVTDPSSEIQRVCQFLGEEFSPSLLDIDVHNSSFAPSSNGIFTESIGRWRSGLQPDEVWWVQQLGKAGMRRFGYQPLSVESNILRLLIAFLSAPFALLRALYVNAHLQGSMSAYLWQRFAAIWSH